MWSKIIGAGNNISTSPKITNYQTCCLKDYTANIKYENVLLDMIESYFVEYEMIINKKYNQIFNKFKKKMMHLGSKINILLPNGDIQNVLLKNLNYNGSLLVEKDGEEENVFSARIINAIN